MFTLPFRYDRPIFNIFLLHFHRYLYVSDLNSLNGERSGKKSISTTPLNNTRRNSIVYWNSCRMDHTILSFFSTMTMYNVFVESILYSITTTVRKGQYTLHTVGLPLLGGLLWTEQTVYLVVTIQYKYRVIKVETHSLSYNKTLSALPSPLSLLEAEMTQLLEGYYKASDHFYKILKVWQLLISFSQESLSI